MIPRALRPCAAVTLVALVGAPAAAAGAPAGAHAGSCLEAPTTAALQTCLDARFRALDRQRMRVVRELRSAAVAERAALLAAEAAWVRFRDADCRFAASLHAGGTLAAIDAAQCRVTLTSQRLAVLRRYLVQTRG